MPNETRHEWADLQDYEILDASDTLDGEARSVQTSLPNLLASATRRGGSYADWFGQRYWCVANNAASSCWRRAWSQSADAARSASSCRSGWNRRST
jgi:hypothetical protein